MRAVDRLSWQSSAQTPLSELNQDARQGHSAAAGFPVSLLRSDQQRRTAKWTKYAQRKQAGEKEEEEDEEKKRKNNTKYLLMMWYS